MGSMSLRQWIEDHWGFLLVALLLVIFSPVFTDIVPNDDVSTLSKVILIAGNIVLAGVAARGDLLRLAAQRELSTARERWDEQHAEQLTSVSQRARLLQSQTEELDDALLEVRTTFADAAILRSLELRADARKRCIRAALKGLCKILEADSRPPIGEPLKAIYFKATLFEYVKKADGRRVLERRYWHYPDTIQPRTLKWDVDDDWNSGAVQAYLRRQEVVMESVADAAREGEVWKDSRPRQHQEYEQSSMVCVPVWAESLPGAMGESDVRAIMTIDTNQLRYFQSSEDERAFRAQVFGPFLGIIRLVYVLTQERGAAAAGSEV